ncbi:uncharacterized protein BDR25DRAFT_358376 [Lindgomyces ingoldianus]|uniref:Uncharacterized protein n=1 Tax=Lindgomyces ingoldianus TaxID=673940 RepID=A0ACB6QME3_9PLEO|nr:uncharacterized protein BDR25DRAFT_358376 [Lindgomyces ingoldianus]KAF2467695.1 hypothetical protein BDR25DRAFT_358376 [Lindgomyces ingoldianus]
MSNQLYVTIDIVVRTVGSADGIIDNPFREYSKAKAKAKRLWSLSLLLKVPPRIPLFGAYRSGTNIARRKTDADKKGLGVIRHLIPKNAHIASELMQHKVLECQDLGYEVFRYNFNPIVVKFLTKARQKMRLFMEQTLMVRMKYDWKIWIS